MCLMLHKKWEDISWVVLILLPAMRARHCQTSASIICETEELIFESTGRSVS